MKLQQIGRRNIVAVVTCLLVAICGSTFGQGSLAAEEEALRTVNLQIEGMTCGACVKDVRTSLAKVAGVKGVEVTVGKKWFFLNDYSDARASVTFEAGKATVEDLLKAVEAASGPLSAYRARLLQEK
jgi:mercuric ion binding protein